ncbi:MAG TPA: efflux RND transporter permease subunit [Bryobacteraceae bacterium]|nr:efflux RND transporter permease subunit [Bryobacteraceae bacterium]
MNLSALFIRRAITTTLIMLGILIFGLLGYRSLPVSDLPNVDFPTIQVSAQLPGANPDTMASAVATPLERQFSTIAGLSSMNSVSALGNTLITLQFDLTRNIDAAGQDVQASIAKAGRQLPPNMPTPPTYQKVNPADQPILYMALSSSTLPLSQVDEYAETLMAQRISMVNGVAQVEVFGSQKYAVRVQLDPDALASRGIGIDDVRQALSSANVNLPNGTLYGRTKAYTVQATGQLTDADAYKPIIVAYRNGNPVRLQELGRVFDSVENDKLASWFRDERSIILAIQRQPGTNTVEIVDNIRKLLPTFRGDIPAAVNLQVLYDRSESIRASISDVRFTLLVTIGLVVLVIFFFLRNGSATLIPSLAVPLSIVGTFGVMDLLGYTLDNLSLMALVLSVGFVVDDAIVMLENIVRHEEMGESRVLASYNGSQEIGFTILSMTLSLVAVFIPVLFMGGIVGRLLREFAVTISVAILVSGCISLTLTPMLCSRFLKAQREQRHGRLYQLSERFFDGLLRAYEVTLKFVLRWRFATLMLSIALVVVTGYLFVVIPKGFLPAEDTGQIFAQTEAAQDVSFEDMVAHQQALAAIVLRNPYVIGFMSSVGPSSRGGAGNAGRIFMHLADRSKRPSAQDIIEQLRPQFAAVPGIRVYMQIPPTIRIGGSLTKSLYQFTMQDTDTKRLYAWEPKLEDRLRQVPGLQDVTSDLQVSSPQLVVNINRDKAQALGVTADAIENALYDSYGQRQVSTIYTPTNEYQVVMEVAPQYQSDPTALSKLYVRSSNNGLIPLSTVCDLKTSVTPLTVNHFGQLPAVTISFNLQPGVSLGEAVDRIGEAARSIGMPATTTMAFQGTAQAFQDSLSGLGILLIVAILVIYLVLGILYESFVHPLTILSGLPSAGLGALLTLMLFHMELDLYAFVGLIMLIGIVKKNAIMMIDFAIAAQRQEGKDAEGAIYEGCLLRFRPIMMTTMAALLGTMPIAVGLGAGAEARRPLGVAVVGGLLVSQLITLYLTPVVYIYLEEFQEWFEARRRRGRTGQPELFEPTVR